MIFHQDKTLCLFFRLEGLIISFLYILNLNEIGNSILFFLNEYTFWYLEFILQSI
jgi:hypothetical protein